MLCKRDQTHLAISRCNPEFFTARRLGGSETTSHLPTDQPAPHPRNLWAHLLSSRGSSPVKLLRRQGCGDVPRVPTGRRSSYSSVLARVAGMPIDVNSFSDEEFIAGVRGSGLRDAKLKSILDERRARHFIDVADLKRRVRPKLTDRELTWLCVGAGSASALPSPKRQRIARAGRAIADCSAPCSAPCSVHWLSRGLVSRSVCAHAQSARAGDSRGDAHAPVIADPPPRRRTSSVGSAPGECCARHVPRTLLTSRYGSRVGTESAGVRGCAPRGPCALTLAPRVRRSTTQCGVRPRALRPLRDTALGGMAWLRAILCQHHWHGGHIQEPCRNVHVHVLTLKAQSEMLKFHTIADWETPVFHFTKNARGARVVRD